MPNQQGKFKIESNTSIEVVRLLLFRNECCVCSYWVQLKETFSSYYELQNYRTRTVCMSIDLNNC